jgi:3,4-dihydroxy-9,10-secoandrosta-1,3,5(10)-triene-9,17-dione 4,5-dioxygenase
MAIRELGYVVIQSPNCGVWREFGEQVLGMASAAGPEGSLYLKMDERDHRLVIVPGAEERFVAAGWSVADEPTFLALRAQLAASGICITSGEEAGRRARRVQDYFSLFDPAGNCHEIFWGPISDFKPFVSPIGVPGFVTGALGLGHVVLPTPNIEEVREFVTEKLGFAVSDVLTMDFGGLAVKLYFVHCDNGRQHSLALARMPAPSGLVHLMVEMPTLKDVGMALDRVQKHGLRLVLTLGQHVNDNCVSFYFLSPGGLMIEIGCGGAVMDWSRHSVFETTLPSHWGHHFVLDRS